MPPPSGATPPDATPGEFGFDFTRFGVRVPVVLVSPLIPAGTVFRVPAGSTPLDHTSVLKTIETRWELPALTARDAAAPDVGDVLSLTTARTDDPLAGVTAPTSTGANPAANEVSHLQAGERPADVGAAGSAERAEDRAAAGQPADAGGLPQLHRGAHGYLEGRQGQGHRPGRLTAKAGAVLTVPLPAAKEDHLAERAVVRVPRQPESGGCLPPSRRPDNQWIHGHRKSAGENLGRYLGAPLVRHRLREGRRADHPGRHSGRRRRWWHVT